MTDNPFERFFADFMPDALRALGDVIPAGQWAQDTTDAVPLVIAKSYAIIEVADELLMDAGVIPDTRPPLPPPSWRTRLRYRVDDAREALARRAYRLIAGYEVPDGE
jgi:hypothetical protein